MESSRRTLLSNPRSGANILSIIFFGWTIPIFRKGYSKVLDVDDIYEPLKSDQSNNLGDQLERQWLKEYKTAKKPSLARALVKAFWFEFLVMGILCFFNDVVARLILPFLLQNLLIFFRKDSDMNDEEAFRYGTSIVIITILNGLGLAHYFFNGYHYGIKVRVAICSIIYRKALQLSQSALGETSPGKIVNLLSNDVNRFYIVSVVMNGLWAAPIFTIAAGIILWQEIRWAGMIGIAVVLLIVPIQSYTGRLSAIFRFQTALRTDERVRFMDEIISGVQVIKLYAWEKPFAKLITTARRLELKVVLKNAYVRALYMTFNIFATRMALFCTVLAIVLMYGRENINVARVFMVSYLFSAISHAMCQSFVRGFAEMAETIVSLRRLQMFLEYEEKTTELPENSENTINRDQLESRNLTVLMKNVSARWTAPTNGNLRTEKIAKKIGSYKSSTRTDTRSFGLHEINLEIQKGKLIGVIGQVGSGKSSLMQVLLGELPLQDGSLGINGALSYASQEAWIFAGTARQNILFGQSMEKSRYDAVIKCTALRTDFEQLSNGDTTMVGERGISLSGGQKARINLARAVYRKADIYLLDDPLSAVDAHVGTHLYNECIGPKGYLAKKNATRILITHQVHFLKDADWIVVLRDGAIESQGTYNDILNSGIDFASIMSKTNEEEEKQPNEKTIEENMERIRSSSESTSKQSAGSALSLASERSEKVATENGNNEDSELLQELEASSRGKVQGSLFWLYLNSARRPFMLCFLIFSILFAQILASSADFWVSYWTRKEESRTILNTTQPLSLPSNHSDIRFFNININLITDSWTTDIYIYIYGGIMGGLFVFAFARSMSLFHLCATSSQNLHDNMFQGLIATTMRFFDINPSGRIVNRCSKDMGAIDEALPKSLLDAVQINLNMLGAILVTVITNIKIGGVVLIMFVFFILIRHIYLKTSKNIKRLEGITKSPVFTHISATLGGLPTIRAFKAEKILREEFDNHQDLNTACWHIFIGTSSGFGISLDIMVYIFISCVIYFFLLLDFDATGDRVGLAITQSLTLTGLLQWGIRQSAEVTNQLMSVERILEYSYLEPEKQPDIPVKVPQDWPSQGKIEFQNIFYRYFAEAEPVLRGLSFSIQPKEKIGIVGRTGAGKSSLIGSIFRLANMDGDILIDNINTAKVDLQVLRSKISIIPQDPVLFSGTLRRNLDPFEEYSDTELWNALENVELKEVVYVAEGLDMPVMAHGSNFSVGQRQLLCLARAILRKNNILVLDEATANVDPRTDQMIQQTIREKFADCTVLTVAHRLHTIIDSDRVIVMDAGKAIEFDEPYLLLQNSNGIFRRMVEALGPAEYDRLHSLAKAKIKNVHNLQ